MEKMQTELDAARRQDNVGNGGGGLAGKAEELVGSGSKRRKIEIECASSKVVEIGLSTSY
jgi:hypothetical protein